MGVILLCFICFVSSIDVKGNVNLFFYSFFNVFSVKLFIMVFFLVWRVCDNMVKYILENVLEIKEVVINVVSYVMV